MLCGRNLCSPPPRVRYVAMSNKSVVCATLKVLKFAVCATVRTIYHSQMIVFFFFSLWRHEQNVDCVMGKTSIASTL